MTSPRSVSFYSCNEQYVPIVLVPRWMAKNPEARNHGLSETLLRDRSGSFVHHCDAKRARTPNVTSITLYLAARPRLLQAISQ